MTRRSVSDLKGTRIMAFRILGLEPDAFRPLFDAADAALEQVGAMRIIAGEGSRLPCRVSMSHATPGEELLLVNYEHQPANTPYRSTHAIYVRKAADRAFESVDVVPDVMASRLLSVRAFDARHMLIDAEVCEGAEAAAMFDRLLDRSQASYLHVHNARHGCYAARVVRA